MDITIQIEKNQDGFVKDLKQQLKLLNNLSIKLKSDDTILINIEEIQIKNKILNVISETLADYIINTYESILLKRIIKSNYCYFNNDEKNRILDISTEILKNNSKNILNSIFSIRRRSLVLRNIKNHFETSNNLIIEGFVNFSLKEYLKDLGDIVDKAVDDFLVERENDEFIKMLKYFISIQDSKYNMVYIKEHNGVYTILDESKNELSKDYIYKVLDEPDETTSDDDLLVSVLIVLAPKQVVLIDKESWRNQELVKTIESIFDNRIKDGNIINRKFEIINGGKNDG